MTQYLLDRGKVAVATFDKPGVAFDEGSEQKFAIDDAIYNQHTQSDLVACAKKTLVSARKSLGSRLSEKVLLAGHSEGAQVAVRLLAQLIAESAPVTKDIEALVLSSMPMGGWQIVRDTQITGETRVAFDLALKNYDNKAIREDLGFDIAATYWRDILATESPAETLRKLYGVRDVPMISVYHGLDDSLVTVDPLQSFERESNERRVAGKPTLPLHVRYYQAGHSLNMAAGNDMLFLMMGMLQ